MSLLTNPRVLPSPQINARYELLEELGSGGMATVHRARDSSSGKVIAFKQLSSARAGAGRRTVEALFEREYHTLVRLRHPRIIEVYDYGFTETGPFYTMELLDGMDLAQLQALPYREACRHLRDVASALALIHSKSLVHRDISPRNIRLTADGHSKLFDFGALCPFGTANEVLGTPLCMAPEILQQLSLDGRTDLYALGAVLYYALTHRHAYPAKSLQELPEAWKSPPPAPSEFVPGIPPAVDRLVLSLLSLNPLARPSSAAEVIERLTAAAELPPQEEEFVSDAYLRSGGMVGRDAEREWVKERVDRALEGKGTEIVLEGPPGVGKTRLLRELSLDARVRGAVVIHADAQATSGSYGTAALLAAGLLGNCPEVAWRTAAPHAGLLRHLSSPLSTLLAEYALVPLPDDIGERRARLQAALDEWFVAVAREQPLFLAVDNLQAADDESAAFLAAFGQVQGLHSVLVSTLRVGDALVAPVPVQRMLQRSGRLRLAGFGIECAEELVKSLFGDVANTGRVARLLHDRSAGMPQQFMDLAQLLVRRNIARYVAGTWVLPFDVRQDELPSRADEILAAKLAGLSMPARELAEAMSVHGSPIPLEQCLALLDTRSQGERHGALDELLLEQVLQSDGVSYRFAQDSVRETLLSHMDEALRRTRHGRVAEALLAGSAPAAGEKLDAAFHFMRAGEESRGADMVARDGWTFISASGAHVSPHRIMRILEEALEVYQRQRRSEYECARLAFPLIIAAFFSSDYRVVLERGPRTLEFGLKITGLDLAQKLRRFLGRKLALVVGLVVGGFKFARQKRLGYDLRTAIGWICGIIPASAGTASICLDSPRADAVRRLCEPLELFGEGEVPALMYDFAQSQYLTVIGRETEAAVLLERTLLRFQDSKVREAVGPEQWKPMCGGFQFSLGIFESYKFGEGALRCAEEMEKLGIRQWVMGAHQVRLLWHALRGESVETELYRKRVEMFALQGSATWQVDMFLPALLLNADFLTGDTVSARRTWEQLGRRSKETPSLVAHERAAHAAYLSLRGDLAPAIALYEKALPDFPVRGQVAWSQTRAYFAATLNAAGQHGRAKELLAETLALVPREEKVRVICFMELERQSALADAGLGNHESAARLLDGLLDEHGRGDNPLIVGLLHKARAEVAVLAGDSPAFERHFREMEVRFRGTRNPALVAQCERLAEKGLRISGGRRGTSLASPDTSPRSVQSFDLTSGLPGAGADPSAGALQLLVAQTRSSAGHVYVATPVGLRLAASSSADEPPPAVLAGLELRIESAAALARGGDPSDGLVYHVETEEDEGLRTVTVLGRAEDTSAEPGEAGSDEASGTAGVSEESGYQVLLLRTPASRGAAIVGGVVLRVRLREFLVPRNEVLEAVATALESRGEGLRWGGAAVRAGGVVAESAPMPTKF